MQIAIGSLLARRISDCQDPSQLSQRLCSPGLSGGSRTVGGCVHQDCQEDPDITQDLYRQPWTSLHSRAQKFTINTTFAG